jgi:hypothetical protein
MKKAPSKRSRALKLFSCMKALSTPLQTCGRYVLGHESTLNSKLASDVL